MINKKKIGLITISISLLLIIIISNLLQVNLINVAILIGLGFLEILFFYAIIARSTKSLLYVTIFVLFQNFILVIISRFISDKVFNLIIISKEIIIYCTIIVYGFKYIIKKNKNKLDKLSIIAMIVFTTYTLFYSKNNFKSSIASYRQIIIPFLFYIYGNILIINKRELVKFLKTYTRIFIFTCFVGLIIYFANDYFWTNIGISEYLNHKGFPLINRNIFGLPRSFYSHDFINIFGVSLKRIASTLVDPVIYSQLVAIVLLYSIFVKEMFNNYIFKYFVIILLTVTLILTFGKGGFVIFYFGFTFCMYNLTNRKKTSKLMLVFGILLFIIVISTSGNSGTSIEAHLNGFTENFKFLLTHPLGNGIGINGNFALKYGSADVELIGETESFIGKIIVETGICGILLYIFYGKYLLSLYNKYKYKYKYKDSIYEIYTVTIGGILGILAVSIFSVSSVSFTGCLFIMTMLGVIIKITENNGRGKNSNI